MRFFVDWLHALLTILFAVALWAAFVTSIYDFFAAVALAVIGYAIAGLVHPHAKKYVFQKTVIFDIHGVYITGDYMLEALYEVEGTRDLIQRLRQKYKVAALTNMGPELWQLWGRKWGIPQMFDYVHYSGQYKIKKPDSRIFEIILRSVNAKSSQTVFLDDLAENVEAARKLGMHGIVFKNPKQAEEDLRKIGFGP